MKTTKLKSKNSYKYFLNNPEIKPPGYPPRIMRTQEALYYLSTNINEFNKNFRPKLITIKLGNHAVGFDRLQIDALINKIETTDIDFNSSFNNNTGCGGKRPNYGGNSIWDEKEHPEYTSVKVFGTSTNKSSEGEFVKALERIRLKKRKNS